MANRNEKVMLSVKPHFGDEQTYRVETVTNRIEPMPGETLTKKQVEELLTEASKPQVVIGRTRA